MKTALPPQLPFVDVKSLFTKADRSMGRYVKEEIAVYPPASQLDAIQQKVRDFKDAEEWFYTRVRKGKERTADLKILMHQCTWEDDHVTLIKEITGASLFDILREVFE